jgi:hypothetical protein
MTHALDSPPIPNHIQAALEACCGGLMTLQVARIHLSNADVDLKEAEEDISRAIESLQRVIAQLRAARAGAKPATLALGFVVAAEDGR